VILYLRRFLTVPTLVMPCVLVLLPSSRGGLAVLGEPSTSISASCVSLCVFCLFFMVPVLVMPCLLPLLYVLLCVPSIPSGIIYMYRACATTPVKGHKHGCAPPNYWTVDTGACLPGEETQPS